jgi:hypothetical protein
MMELREAIFELQELCKQMSVAILPATAELIILSHKKGLLLFSSKKLGKHTDYVFV